MLVWLGCEILLGFDGLMWVVGCFGGVVYVCGWILGLYLICVVVAWGGFGVFLDFLAFCGTVWCAVWCFRGGAVGCAV